jgi:hypothetical protein
MGTSFRKPLLENPKGFFEDESARTLNDAVLEFSEYTVKDWRNTFGPLTFSFFHLGQALKWLEERNESVSHWGWKDPRTCLTLPFWFSALSQLDLLEQTRFLRITRNPCSVARSLVSRGNVSSIEEGKEIAHLYETTANRALAEYRMEHRIANVTYEGLLDGSSIDYLDLHLNIEINRDLVDQALNRSGTGEQS